MSNYTQPARNPQHDRSPQPQVGNGIAYFTDGSAREGAIVVTDRAITVDGRLRLVRSSGGHNAPTFRARRLITEPLRRLKRVEWFSVTL